MDTIFPSLAHSGPFAHDGFAVGFFHPLLGLDHLLAMLAVGLWAAQGSGQTRWSLPAAFVGFMLLGGLLVWFGVAVPMVMVESGILASVLVLGLLILWAYECSPTLGVVLAGAFAICHGAAHAAELPTGASAITYALGFASTTALLHIAGIGLGISLRHSPDRWIRACGGAVIAGVLLLTAGGI